MKKIIFLINLLITLIISLNLVIGCPTENEFKFELKKSLYNYMQNPESSKVTLFELKDLIVFYLTEDIKFINCDLYIGFESKVSISTILTKSNTISESIIPRCTDGTFFGECSNENKPYFCFMGESVQRCSGADKILGNEDDCGCPVTLECQALSGKCGVPCGTLCPSTYSIPYCIDDNLMQKETTYACFDDICSESGENLLLHQDCTSNNQACINDQCIDVCIEDSDCITGKVCYNSTCINCKTDLDCYSWETGENKCNGNIYEKEYTQMKCINQETISSYCDSYQTYLRWGTFENCSLTDKICLDGTFMGYPACIPKPILQLNFEDGELATTFRDSINNYNFQCSEINCPQWTSNFGLNNSGTYKFDGEFYPKYIFRDNFDYGPEFTINFFFKPLNNNEGIILYHGNDVSINKNTIKIRYDNSTGDDIIETRIKDKTGKPSSEIYSLINDDEYEYQMYTIVVRSGDIRVYINGIQNPTQGTTMGGNLFLTNSQFYIGNDDSESLLNNFNGYIDEFTIWNISLSEIELNNLKNYYYVPPLSGSIVPS